MSAVLTGAAATTAEHATQRRPSLTSVLRFEMVKLLGAGRTKAVLLAALVAPAIYIGVVSRQSSLPADTVFGRWMGQTGWAGALVVLAFACSWGLPLLASLAAGDVFAAEDRLGTWRHLLVAVRSPRLIFTAKSLAALVLLLLLVTALAVSGVVGGLIGAGSHPLVGLDGHLLSPGEAARSVALSWLCVLAPTLAFAALGLLGSVILGRSPMGLLAPAAVALAMNLVLLLPVPVAVRLALPSNTFVAWRGLFTDPRQDRALLIGVAVSLAWAAVATALAYRLFVRRDFTDLANDGAGRRAALAAGAPLAALTLASAVAIGLATPASATGIRKAPLEASLATSFAHLYVQQTQILNRPAVSVADLSASAACDKGGERGDDRGPGNDWRCVVSWRLPGSSAEGQAIYQLDVTAEGRYVADGDGPKEVNGAFTVRTPQGDAPNPLWQFDGAVALLD